MQFNSIEFLVFFPIVVLLYFALPKKVKQYWLLAAGCELLLLYVLECGVYSSFTVFHYSDVCERTCFGKDEKGKMERGKTYVY